jgi:hypothetical protein
MTMNTKKLKVWAGILLVFFLGALAGSLGTSAYLKHRIERFSRGKRPSIRMVLIKKLDRELDLTDTQRVEVEKILDQLETKLRELRQKHRPDLEEAFAHSFDRIKDRLDQEQKPELDKIRQELRKRHPSKKEESR